MKVLYNYKPYDKPRKARYFTPGDKYTFPDGWSKIEVECIVIGETKDSYITRLIEHKICDTTEPNYGKVFLMPIGFHKSRLLKWLQLPDKQLTLFD